MNTPKVTIGYAVFRADGHLKWCYKDRAKARINVYDGAFIFPIGYDFFHEVFYIEIPKRFRSHIHIDQFWALAHGWVRKALNEYLIEHNNELRIAKDNDDYI